MQSLETLPLKLTPVREIPESDWPKLKSEAAAVRYAVEHCGLIDKAVAAQAGIDTATLSKAKSGQARLSESDMDALMDGTGLESPLIAWLLRRGYDPRSLRKLETETERALREEREALKREREKTALLTELLQGKSA